ncbi:hypothetical protein EUGRSUZ_C03556 [Eucalyptus grandis]|uniref:Uncharacterized protein n=2 Tax=Eucalyptus grandis TaxID=71139 RepID=A0A059CUK9_EUCGR|nr:hypothetical protein EUGRSUZ_C03556 [Eucalyptus grandis]
MNIGRRKNATAITCGIIVITAFTVIILMICCPLVITHKLNDRYDISLTKRNCIQMFFFRIYKILQL